MKPYSQYIFEEVYGHQAIVYHRTGSQPDYKGKLRRAIDTLESFQETTVREETIFQAFSVINGIIGNGFSTSLENVGKMYGNGVYTTYDFESQIRAIGNKTNMEEEYGNIVIKSKLNLTNFLILDYQVAAKVYGMKHTLRDQCAKLGLTKVLSDLDKPKSPIARELADYTDAEEALRSNAPGADIKWATSDIALCLHKYYFIDQKVSGIIFTGSRDGHVAVVYNPKLLVPYSFAITDEENIVLNWVPYNRFLSKNVVASYVDALVGEFDSTHKERSDRTAQLDKYEVVDANAHGRRWYPDNLVLIKYRGRYGIADRSGKIIIKPQFTNIDTNGRYDVKYTRLQVTKGDRVGIIDDSGNVIIPIIYDDVFYEGIFFDVVRDGYSALFNSDGKQLSDFKYEDFEYNAASDSIVCSIGSMAPESRTNRINDIYDKNGRLVKSLVGYIVIRDGKYVVQTKTSMYLINENFERSSDYPAIYQTDGIYQIVGDADDNKGVIDANTFEEILPLKYSSIKFLVTKKSSGTDKTGNLVYLTTGNASDYNKPGVIHNLVNGDEIENVYSNYTLIYSSPGQNLGVIIVDDATDDGTTQRAYDRDLNRILPQYKYFEKYQNYGGQLFFGKKEWVEKDGKADFYSVDDDGEITFNGRI